MTRSERGLYEVCDAFRNEPRVNERDETQPPRGIGSRGQCQRVTSSQPRLLRSRRARPVLAQTFRKSAATGI
jgi:hypothetical protein